MVIEPKVRGFICTTAHPLGCTQNVYNQIRYVKKQAPIVQGPKKVLVIGASTGYGLASRIVAAFGAKAQTIGVFLGRPAEEQRTASAGWYNTAAFEQAAHQAGLYAKSIQGDAFSDVVKQEVMQLIQKDWAGGVDLIIYSLASPRRTDPKTGRVFHAVIKPIGQAYTTKTIDVSSGCLSDITVLPAKEEETEGTIAVMGGADWLLWTAALLDANLLAKGVQTVAYSYTGPLLTHPIYTNGTIGQAKNHLYQTRQVIEQQLAAVEGQAFIAINKAVVTQASSAIPAIPLYISLLYKVMKEKKLHEGCIEQLYRLYADHLYRRDLGVAETHLIRMDDREMQEDVQQVVAALWPQVNGENVGTLTDFSGYQRDFYQLFGFQVEGIDYTQACDVKVMIPSLEA